MTERRTVQSKWIRTGIRNGWIGEYEQELLSFIHRQHKPVPHSVETVLVFTSLFLKSGHVCLPLDKSPREWISVLDIDIKESETPPDIVTDEIAGFPATGRPGESSLFILENKRFFFRRFWYYEKRLAEMIKERATGNITLSNPKAVRSLLNEQFPAGGPSAVDKQKIAVSLSLIKQLLVISGGPGTGKTSILGRIIGLQLQLAGKPLKIALAAPTGKAANRMTASVSHSFEEFGTPPELAGRPPIQAVTLHRLLVERQQSNLLPDSGSRPLPYDLIIVDEASMIDLSLMYRLFRRLNNSTKLILLGDREQLSSVEAGAVFVELCRSSRQFLSSVEAGFLNSAGVSGTAGLSENSAVPGGEADIHSGAENRLTGDDVHSENRPFIIVLDKNYRFSENSGIEKLKKAIQQSHPDEACRLLESGLSDDLFYSPFNYSADDLRELCRSRADTVRSCQGKSPEEVIDIWLTDMWLSVRRSGPAGSKALNRMIEEHLIRNKMALTVNGWYSGRPVLVTRNDYSLGLFNGDLGVCRLDEQQTPLVYFPNHHNGLKMIHAGRLGEYEPAYIMTVHKSQGSEFENVTLLLPDKMSAILTKELIYTAVTRAGKTFTLSGDLNLLKEGIRRESVRFSTLGKKIATN